MTTGRQFVLPAPQMAQPRLPTILSPRTLWVTQHPLFDCPLFMSRFALTITRFASSAWVGAAVLFVINGVQQTTSGKFESMTTDQLVLLRFPAYYLMGFLLVGLSLLGATLSGSEVSPRQRRVMMVLFGLSLVIMLFDYLMVYLPLAEMITPPGKARPQGFQTLHKWSMRVNSFDLLLVLIGSLTACWPRRVAPDAR